MKNHCFAVCFVVLFFHFSLPAKAQYIPQPGAAEILQSLKKLNTVGSVLYVAAHPDDENTRLLAYMAREKNLRTGYISITRGDGGQNLVGKEQGDGLGLIRTQELLAARRTDGAEQFFTRANDFGYSKNPEETFDFWNRDTVLGDMVWVIRNFRPDLIICRFPVTGEGGHGHHTASAILAVEAFNAAADPKRYPEQLAYTQTWQAKRVFFNAFNFGSNNTISPDQVKLDVGAYNTLLGKSYGEIAAESRSFHKSQGFGSARTRGSILEYFKLLKGDSVSTDIFERIDHTWNRIPESADIRKLIEKCILEFDPQHPGKTVQGLVKVHKSIGALKGTDPETRYWKKQKTLETESLIIACAGLWLEAAATDFTAVPGGNFTINVNSISRSYNGILLDKVTFPGKTDTTTALTLRQNELNTFSHTEALSSNLPYSSPYWLNEKHGDGYFTVRNRMIIGMPENEPGVIVKFHIRVEDLVMTIEKPVIYKYTDPVKGEVYRPFEVLPPATVNMMEKVMVYNNNDPRNFQFIIRANRKNVKGKLIVETPAGWSMRLNYSEFDLKEKGDEAILEGALFPVSNAVSGAMHAALNIDNELYTKSVQRIEYDHIPYQFILSDAETKLVRVPMQKVTGHIGYIPGAGDEVASCLKQLGYRVTTLTDEMLAGDNLSVYSAIVTGIRAYNVNDRLQVHYSRLMNYVSKGGNLVVQYNTNSRVGPVLAKIGPYPFTVSRDRVTNEHAEVKLLEPGHVVFNTPNKIDTSDFSGWVQERGIYFATETDPQYSMLMSMHDPDNKEMNGSLITAKYGKGNFVYTGLAFFRQLPAGVPGAYRLFVNLLSMPPQP